MVLSLPGLTPPCPRWAGAALPSRPPVCIKGQCLRPSTTLGLEMGPVYSFVFSDVLEILPPPCCSNCSSSPHFQLQCRLLQFSGCAPWALSRPRRLGFPCHLWALLCLLPSDPASRLRCALQPVPAFLVFSLLELLRYVRDSVSVSFLFLL